MRMAVQKMFRALVCLSLLLNGCCIGWFMFGGGSGRAGRSTAALSGRGAVTGESCSSEHGLNSSHYGWSNGLHFLCLTQAGLRG